MPVNQKQINLLVVEDDEHFYNLLRAHIALINKVVARRFELNWMDHWQEGKADILNGYDAVLLDYYLGEHSGIDILKEAMAIKCRVPIIFLTASSSRKIYETALANGASGFIVKDKVDPFMLESIVRFAIVNAEQKDQIRHMALHDQLTGLMGIAKGSRSH